MTLGIISKRYDKTPQNTVYFVAAAETDQTKH
jgi:hypothetical protein